MVVIKSSSIVKPNEPTPNVKLWLPESDQIKPWTHSPVFSIYRPKTDISVSSAFESMKFSLSCALVPYYPLAGRLNSIGGGRFELNCNAMGAVIIEAESEAEIIDFGDFRPSSKTRKLVPSVDYTKGITDVPLLLAQITRFRCGAIVVGIAISRIAADGIGGFGFGGSWAKIHRGEKDIVGPIHDRTAFYKGDPIAKPCFDHVEFKAFPLLIGNRDAEEERRKETTTRMLRLSKYHVEYLKKKANQGRTKYSRFEAMTGHIWRCASKARRLQNEQLTTLRITVDCRNRLQPPLPSGYTGSGTMITIATAKSGELLSNPLGLGFACSLIRRSVEKVNDAYIRSATNFLTSQEDLTPYRSGFHNVDRTEGKFLGNPNLSITSWFGLPIYDRDFGWGKPIFTGLSSLGSDGKVVIMPGGEEDGSANIPIRLQVAYMDDFVNFFYKDIIDEDGDTAVWSRL